MRIISPDPFATSVKSSLDPVVISVDAPDIVIPPPIVCPVVKLLSWPLYATFESVPVSFISAPLN